MRRLHRAGYIARHARLFDMLPVAGMSDTRGLALLLVARTMLLTVRHVRAAEQDAQLLLRDRHAAPGDQPGPYDRRRHVWQRRACHADLRQLVIGVRISRRVCAKDSTVKLASNELSSATPRAPGGNAAHARIPGSWSDATEVLVMLWSKVP